MRYLVEVRRSGGGLADQMAEMRAWLDREGIEPGSFHHFSDGEGIAFRLSFNGGVDAKAFALAFQGRLKTLIC